MARAAGINIENSFTRGLITEASGLNFPENACTETYDCVFEQTGKVVRRYGFNYENSHSFENGINIGYRVITEYRWENVAGDGNITFIVTQIGNNLRFYEEDNESSLSSGKKSFTVNLNDYRTKSTDRVRKNHCQFASGNGYLFISHPYVEPIYVEYKPNNDNIVVRQINIKIRDFDGVSDGTSPGERPTTLTKEHRYNLYNQSWYGEVGVVGSGDKVANPLEDWTENRSDYPSNSDVWWYYKDASDRFDYRNVERFEIGNTRAPRGHYILDAFEQNRSSASGISGLSKVSSNGNRPTACAFFAGRVWYGGVNYQDFNSNIYFSQLATTRPQYSKCYQDQDPTSEILHDLLPTDGGVIVIPEIGNIVKMVPIQSALVVFASNGIWSITGSQGIGFTANDYSVTKISSISSLSHLSFVDVKGFPFWWNDTGIHTVTGADQLANLEVRSLSEQTIKSFYLDIPPECRVYAKGAYNERDNIVQWVYRATEVGESLQSRYNYDRVLNLNLNTGAFYPWTIPTLGSVYICGIVVSAGKTASTEEEAVTDDAGDTVTDSVLEDVFVLEKSSRPSDESFRYYTYRKTSSTVGNFTWSECFNDDYMDWKKQDSVGVSFTSYFITGYKVHGDGAKDFQSNYVWVYVDDVINGSCYFQGIRDYTTSGNSGKFSTSQQVYVDLPHRSVQIRKFKVRGQGKVMQLKFRSEQGKPFSITGFVIFESAPEIP